MSFSNFSSASETSLDKNSDAESDVSAVSKLSVIERADKFSINLSQSSDNQYVLYSLKDSKKVEIFLTWWNETSYTIVLKKRENDLSDSSFVWRNSVNFKNATSSTQYFHETADIFREESKFLYKFYWTMQNHSTIFWSETSDFLWHFKSQWCKSKKSSSMQLVLNIQISFFLSHEFITFTYTTLFRLNHSLLNLSLSLIRQYLMNIFSHLFLKQIFHFT